MHPTSRFSKLAQMLGLCVAVCVISTSAMAQGPGKFAGRTAAEQKMDSALIDLTRAAASGQLQSSRLQELPARVQDLARQNVVAGDTIFVVIKGTVSAGLTAFIRQNGGVDVSEFPAFDTITAQVPLAAVAEIAKRGDVQTIGPKEEATTNRYIPTPEERRRRLQGLLQSGAIANAGAAVWEGVKAHKADVAHAAGHTGVGAKVCVLSDGVNSLAARQATGDLPAGVTVLSGQAGLGDEGTAMLEIVHDMAPGASLAFASAFASAAQFATNILNLRSSLGCDIIVDDVNYFNEGAFQDGPIAQAVNTVTANGALYLSSAANSGNLTHATSGTFEGDFVASAAPLPAVIAAVAGVGAQAHDFGGLPYTTLIAVGTAGTAGTRRVSLKWSDPLGGSGNDYDLYITNSTGNTILSSSTSTQSGTQDPYEFAARSSNYPANSRIYIVKYSGAVRALRLDTHRGQISNGTTGSTYGHNAAGSAVSVAAVDVATAGGGAFVGGATNPVENYSSDGPRKMFYQPNGTAITSGNVLFGTNGGTTLQKVDLAAGDCGTTTTPGFLEFCGTSAAAPTVAAIAALIKGANPTATSAQILATMKVSTLDIEAAGWDRDSGAGIVMVPSPLVFASTYTIGGSVSGLGAGKSVGLLNNGADPITRNANGSFTFPTPVASGASYLVTVGAQPAGQNCTVANGTGTATANVTNVSITCVNAPGPYTISGTVSGLGAGKTLGLLNNGGDPVSLGANGSFTFPTAVANGASYAVTVGTQPAGQNCTVANGNGTASANVTNVAVSCLTTTLSGNTSTGTGAASATLSGGGAACGFTSGSFAAAPAAAAPAGVSFPHGFLSFTAGSCPAASGAVTFTVTYPSAIPAGAQYYKYGKEPGNPVNHYYTIPATISGNQVTFTITDGLIGDDDVTANGTIVDPGAIGIQAAAAGPVVPVPTLSQYALMALALLMLLAAGAQMGRRRP